MAGTTAATVFAWGALYAYAVAACGEQFPSETADAGITDATSESTANDGAHDGAIDAPSADASLDAIDESPQIDGDLDANAADASTDAAPDSDASNAADASDATDATDASNCPQVPLTTTDAGGTCGVVIQSYANEGNAHIAEGSPTVYCTEPPSSGAHYPVWANYTTYTKPVADGYLVHALEHGAIVIRYQCATSCPSVAADLQAVIDAHPLDPMCDGTIKSRLILVPDPNLDVPIAASAWTWTYRATCVDGPSLTAFINAHYAQASENTCAAGVVPP